MTLKQFRRLANKYTRLASHISMMDVPRLERAGDRDIADKARAAAAALRAVANEIDAPPFGHLHL